MKKKISVLIGVILFSCHTLFAADLPKVSVSVMAVGTVNWLLETITRNELDKKNGYELVIDVRANMQASRLAVRDGSAHFAVADWIWISAQRNKGERYQYMPYSRSIGSLMVHPKAGINALKDLSGKKIGIVGGPNDKGWLLIRALIKKNDGIEVADKVEMFFGAPPLLKKKIQDGELDAVITYWHYASELESLGFNELISLEDLYSQLGFSSPVPVLGFFFQEAWANQNPELVNRFQRSYRQAQTLLAEDKGKWNDLAAVIKPKSQAHNDALYKNFISGIPESFTEADISNAQKLYALFAEYGDKIEFGANDQVDPALFFMTGE